MNLYWRFRNWYRDNVFEPIWYRVFGHKHHIVKTTLPPSPWYDTDIRMLYCVMDLVKWYVENDMIEIDLITYEQEVVSRKNSNYDAEFKEKMLNSWKDQYERQLAILDIYKWWKNYSNREKEISNALTSWHDFISKFCDDKDFDSFLGLLNNRNNIMSEEERMEEERLGRIYRDLEEKLQKEEQIMLHKAIELRESMWS